MKAEAKKKIDLNNKKENKNKQEIKPSQYRKADFKAGNKHGDKKVQDKDIISGRQRKSEIEKKPEIKKKFERQRKQEIQSNSKIEIKSEKQKKIEMSKKMAEQKNPEMYKKMGQHQKPELQKKSRLKNNQETFKSKDRSKTQEPAINIKQTGKRNNSCPVIKKCGGCQVLAEDYQKHLLDKQKMVEKLIGKYCKVEEIIGMEKPFHYRNKVHAVFDHDKKGNPISGVYEEGTHRVVPVESCLIHNKKADEIINSIRGLLKSFKIKTYNEDTEFGLLRHVLIRIGRTSGEIMVVLVTASPIFPSKNNFVKAIKKLHPEITTIIQNINDKKTSMILGDREQVMYGKGYIEDSLCDKVFRISAKSFYQVNPVQTEVLYRKAIELANLTGKETIIDAYCGIGTIGLIASDGVKAVIGIELNKDAVRDAVTNAKRNDIKNIEFYNADAGEYMNRLTTQNQSADVVFLDPPRAGSDEKFLSALVTLNPEKIVYISCNPITLERDLQYITKKGYKAMKAVPVDMFPWTEHVETCCLLYKVN